MLLQVCDFELGPPEEPHGISHGHHLRSALTNGNFGTLLYAPHLLSFREYHF